MAPWNVQSQGSRESSQHSTAQGVDLGEKDGAGDTHPLPFCTQQRGHQPRDTQGTGKGGSCQQLVPSQHTLCLCSFTHHLTSEDAALREGGDQANSAKTSQGMSHWLCVRGQALEGEGQQGRGTLSGDGCRMIKRLSLGPCIGDPPARGVRAELWVCPQRHSSGSSAPQGG